MRALVRGFDVARSSGFGNPAECGAGLKDSFGYAPLPPTGPPARAESDCKDNQDNE
jgi:hypothetical protein